MKTRCHLPSLPLFAACLFTAPHARGADLFSEDFDSEPEAKIQIVAGNDATATFVDYSTMTVGSLPHSIPEAPRPIAGSVPTRGVLLKVSYANPTVTTERTVNLVAVDPITQLRLAVTDNYRLKFDAYLRLSPAVTLNAAGVPSNNGTTEHLLWGVGYAPLNNHVMGRNWRTNYGSGVWGFLATECGAGTNVANGGDAGLYIGAGNNAFGARSLEVTADRNTYFNPAFGALASPVPGCPANQWVQVDITALGGRVTVQYHTAGNTPTPFYENISGPVSGGIMVGYEDAFASVSFDPDNQWMLVDNMVVEDLAPPTMQVTPGGGWTGFLTSTGFPTTATYDVSNLRTTGDLTITAVNFSGTNAPDFSVVTPLPLVVAAGTSQPLTLQYTPNPPDGPKSATATLVSDDPQSPEYVLSDLRVRRSFGSFLEAHYKLEESSGRSAADSSGNGVTATLQVRDPIAFGRPTLLGASDTGTAMGFLPAQSGLTGNYLTSNVVHTPTFSISMWIRPAATGEIRTLFQRDPDFDSNHEEICGLLLTTTNTLKYRVRNEDVLESDPGQPLTDDTVWHVVLTHLDEDGFENTLATRSRLYVNGRQVDVRAGDAARGFGDYPLTPTAAGLHIASRTFAGFGFSGDIDDIQVYGAELSREQVWELYKRPGATASPEFAILSAEHTSEPAGFTLSFPSSPDGAYQLFRSGDLNAWDPVGNSITGHADALTTTASDPSPPAGIQFYRVGRD